MPTESVAVLAMVAKPLREAQSCLLTTAIRRRGKTAVPNPPTTRALLDALLVGEPHYFCETWERGYSPQWRMACRHDTPLAINSSVEQSPDGGYFLEMPGPGGVHRGFVRSLQAPNLLVRRLRVTMSYTGIHDPHRSIGYVLLCGPLAPTHQGAGGDATDDFMGGPRFSSEGNGVVSLVWLEYVHDGDNEARMIVEGVTPNTRYVVEATFRHESTSCFGTVDISVDGHTVVQGMRVAYSPLSSIQLYNWSDGIARIGGIEIWSEKATPDQVWKV